MGHPVPPIPMSIGPSTKNRVPAAVPSPGTAKALRLIEYMINATGVETGGSTEGPMHFIALTELEVLGGNQNGDQNGNQNGDHLNDQTRDIYI